MPGWLAALSADRLDNWEICKANNWFGSPASRAAGVRAGDDIFVWFSDQGLRARCRATADAEPVGPDTFVPWPEPGRYRYVWPIELLDEADSPVERTGKTVDAVGRIGGVPFSQFPQIPDDGVRELRAMFGGAGPSRPDTVLMPPVDLAWMGTDHRVYIDRSIAYRRGQAGFRSALLTAWRSRCAVTETEVIDVLEAAHIHPYRGEHTDRPDNGLLLRSDMHTLFDLYRLTVLPDRTVRVHPDLRGTEYDVDLRRIPFPVASADRPAQELLEWHNRQCEWL